MIQLTEENFVMFAIQHYDNPSCSGRRDFDNDLKRFKYIKRLLRRYSRSKEISEHLLVNHLIVLHNLFGDSMIDMLFFKIEKRFWPQLKTFLVFLNYLPDNYKLPNGKRASDLALDVHIIGKLRKV